MTSLENTVTIPTEIDLLEASKIGDVNKIKRAINEFSPFKAAGEDRIFPALSKNGIEFIANNLVKIFTACWPLPYMHKSWQKVKVIFIPKPGRESYELAKSFRPISLTSFLLKTLERFVEQSIRDGPLKKYPLHESQHAYQEGKSAETALHNLVSRVEGALEQNSFAMGLGSFWI
jgi:hypothetical protein